MTGGLRAGWAFPIGASQAHYFPAGHNRSVCGGWEHTGTREAETGERTEDDCVVCVATMTTFNHNQENDGGQE